MWLLSFLRKKPVGYVRLFVFKEEKIDTEKIDFIPGCVAFLDSVLKIKL